MRADWAGGRLQGLAHIGALAQEVTGDADVDLGRRLGKVRGILDEAVDSPWRLAQQKAERIGSLSPLLLEARDLGVGLLQAGRCLGDIQGAGLAKLEAHLGHPQPFRLGRRIGRVDGHLGAQGAQGDEGIGNARDECHQRIVVSGNRTEQGAPVRLDVAPVLAPEVELPGRAQPDLPGDEIGFGTEQPGVPGLVKDRSGQRLLLRILGPDGDIELGLGLQDSDPRDLQRRVVAVRGRHEGRQRRAVEIPPPVPVRGALLGTHPLPMLAPAWIDRDLGFDEIRTDGAGSQRKRRQRQWLESA